MIHQSLKAEFKLMAAGKFAELKQGHAICFASFNHRVNPVKRGVNNLLLHLVWSKPLDD